jgi:DNA-binding NtrC family response regulator
MITNKLLLVDDEVAFLEPMAKRLKKRDFTVSTATSGMEALEIISQDNEKVDVVILDVKMPGMDGIETLAEIKRKFPLIEVIMLTGHGTIASAIDGMKQGAFDYLVKPCDMTVLVDKVNEAAEKKRKHEEKIIEARLQEITLRRP